MTHTQPPRSGVPEHTRTALRFVFVMAVALAGVWGIGWLVDHPTVVLIGVVLGVVFTVIYLLNVALDHLADTHHNAALYRHAARFEAHEAAPRAQEETP